MHAFKSTVSLAITVGSFDGNQRCPMREVLAEGSFGRLQQGCLQPNSPHFHLMAQYQACSKDFDGQLICSFLFLNWKLIE